MTEYSKKYRQGLAYGLSGGLAAGLTIARLQTTTDKYLAWGLFVMLVFAIYLSSRQWSKKLKN